MVGAIISLPISVIVAFLEVGYHSFIQALLVSFIAFWFLSSAAVYFYLLATRVRSSINNANMGKFDPSQDMRTIRNKYQAMVLFLVIVNVVFISFFPTNILGLYGNLSVFFVLGFVTALIWRKGRQIESTRQ